MVSGRELWDFSSFKKMCQFSIRVGRQVLETKKISRESIQSLGLEDRGFPDFGVGDRIEVFQIVKEGDKEREQKFEGDVIAFRNNGISTTFTVRKIASKGVGVERIFPYYSPIIAKIAKLKTGVVRRAKLYYLRDRIGKGLKIKGH